MTAIPSATPSQQAAPAPRQPAARYSPGRYLGDVGVMTRRCLAHAFRSIDTIITVIAMPVMMMLMFVYVFGGAMNLGSYEGTYVDYQLPGILIIAIASAIAYTAVRLNGDVTSGIFDRFHSMPIARSSILWGHVLTSVLQSMASVAACFIIALIMGFRPHMTVGGFFLALGILLLFTLATTWMATISGLAAKTAETAGVFSYPLIFLPFLSSAFVPTATMPGPLRAFAEHQPVTSIVDSLRNLFSGQPVGGELWMAAAWCAGIFLLCLVIALRIYRRHVS